MDTLPLPILISSIYKSLPPPDSNSNLKRTLDAFETAYGVRALADYDFSKADAIVSVGADILGDWQGGGYDSAYSKKRVPHRDHGKGHMSQHFQFEANMTLSGAAADFRVPATPTQQKHIFDDEVRVLEIEHKHAP